MAKTLPDLIITCKGCGMEFHPEYSNQKFHSFFCRKNYESKYRKLQYIENKLNPKPKTRKCIECGKVLKVKCGKKFCSKECYKKYRNRERSKKAGSLRLQEKLKDYSINVVNEYKSINMGGFTIKVKKNNKNLYFWEVSKDEKVLLKSAESFEHYKDCVKDVVEAMR